MNKKRLPLVLIALLAIVAIDVPLAILNTGCKSTPQTVAYKTISGVETTATTELNSYYALVIKGTVRTNDVPAVSAAFNHLQLSVAAAVVEASGNTNAAAPVALVAEAGLFTAEVASASTAKK